MNGYITMTCKKPYHCSFDCKICIYSDLEHFKKLYNEVTNELTKYKNQHRLSRNYNKICFTCKKIFYEKRLNIIYCSDDCREKGKIIKQKENHRIWYQKNKEHVLEYQRIQRKIKHSK